MQRLYVVSYDISDDKRRNEVFKTLCGYGDHAQFSVFFCQLSEMELIGLRGSLRAAINEHDDQIMIIDLGRSVHPLETDLEVLGKPYKPRIRALVV